MGAPPGHQHCVGGRRWHRSRRGHPLQRGFDLRRPEASIARITICPADDEDIGAVGPAASRLPGHALDTRSEEIARGVVQVHDDSAHGHFDLRPGVCLGWRGLLPGVEQSHQSSIEAGPAQGALHRCHPGEAGGEDRQRQPHLLRSQPAQGGVEIREQALRPARSGRGPQRLQQELDPRGQCGSLGPGTCLQQIARAGQAGQAWHRFGWPGCARPAGRVRLMGGGGW